MKAALYLRISQDRTGEELGIDRQREQCRALAGARGWDVAREYVDNDVSAASGKRRPQWEALMADVEAGRLGVVIGWTLDRICRTARDRLRLLDAGRDRGLVIALARGSDMDLSTPSGRLAADILGAVALAEIEQKADRQKAAHRQAAAQGRRIGGRRPFGFEQDGMTVRPVEAEALVRAYHDYLAGTPLLAIAKRWNEAGLLSGVPRANGDGLSEWNHSGVRFVLRNARYAGFRVHNGEVVGKAQWPALVPEHVYRATVALLDSAASEFKPKGGRRLLTGIARCAVCDLPIHVGGNRRDTPPVYRCPTGRHVTRRAELVEEFVVALVLARVARADFREALAELADDGQAADLSAEAERIRTEMDAIARERMQRIITPRQFAVMNAELVAQLEDVERRMSSSGGTSALREFVDGGVTRGRWDALGVDQQRVHVASLMSIRLHSGGRGVRVPPPETVEIAWKTNARSS